MASVPSRKRVRKDRVADMTPAELQDLMEKLLDRKMAEWASDPRIVRRRAEIAANAAAARHTYHAGKTQHGTVEDLLKSLD